MLEHFSAPSCWCAKSSAECGVVIVQLQRLQREGSVLKKPEGDGSQGEDRTFAVTPQLALSCDMRDVGVSCVKSYQDFSLVMNKIVGAELNQI